MKKNGRSKFVCDVISEVYANLTEGPRDPAIFKAIFMAGGPGSGKSFVANHLGLSSLGFRKSDPDVMYQYLIRRAGNDLDTFDIGSPEGQEIRSTASELTDKRTEMGFLAGRLGILFDGTGKDFNKIKNNKDRLELMGYESLMVFVNADLETAMARNRKRPRKVPDEMVKRFWTDVQKNVGKFQSLFGQNFIIIDNSSTTSDADLNLSINRAYKQIRKWAETPPRSPIAKRWISDQP